MSGSPILNAGGAAIGVVSSSGSGEWNVNPALPNCLPQWFWRELNFEQEAAT
jgi:hypothetical protein